MIPEEPPDVPDLDEVPEEPYEPSAEELKLAHQMLMESPMNYNMEAIVSASDSLKNIPKEIIQIVLDEVIANLNTHHPGTDFTIRMQFVSDVLAFGSLHFLVSCLADGEDGLRVDLTVAVQLFEARM